MESVITAVEHFHKQDDFNFALISDLTSFIDIGDILLIKDKQIQIVECKEGDVQKKVFDFLDYASQDDFDVTKIDYSDKNHKFFDQVERTLKQMEKILHWQVIHIPKPHRGALEKAGKVNEFSNHVIHFNYVPQGAFDRCLPILVEKDCGVGPT